MMTEQHNVFIPRPTVYIAGPYSGSTGYHVEQNILRAGAYILPIAECGGAPLCPHTMTRGLDGTLTYEDWIAITLSLLARSDAMLLTPDWIRSSGANTEHDFCAQTGRFEGLGLVRIKVFRATEAAAVPWQLGDWLADENARRIERSGL